MADTLDLCTNRLLDCREMQVIVKQAGALVGHFKMSSTAMANLKAMCEALKVNFLTPKQDVPTRWGSTKTMI